MASGRNQRKAVHHGANVYSTHAEIDAVMRLNPELLTKAKIYVARLGAMGQITNSRPCPRCEVALRAMGVKTVYYSIEGLNHWGQLDLR
jgi:deoxycytidylate deaminase